MFSKVKLLNNDDDDDIYKDSGGGDGGDDDDKITKQQFESTQIGIRFVACQMRRFKPGPT